MPVLRGQIPQVHDDTWEELGFLAVTYDVHMALASEEADERVTEFEVRTVGTALGLARMGVCIEVTPSCAASCATSAELPPCKLR